jgi:hypothetical protein
VQGVMEEINKRKGRFADPDVDEDDEDHKRPPPPPSPRVQRRKRSGNIEERTKDILQRYGHVLRAKPVSRKAEQEAKRDGEGGAGGGKPLDSVQRGGGMMMHLNAVSANTAEILEAYSKTLPRGGAGGGGEKGGGGGRNDCTSKMECFSFLDLGCSLVRFALGATLPTNVCQLPVHLDELYVGWTFWWVSKLKKRTRTRLIIIDINETTCPYECSYESLSGLSFGGGEWHVCLARRGA